MSKLDPLHSRTQRKTKEDIHFEISFYESLVKEDPNFKDVLIPLAENYTKAGRHEDALKIDLKLSELLPSDPTVHYNLACSYSLLNQISEASTTLRKAVDLGYRDFKHLEEDPDLANLRAHPDFRTLKEKFLKKI